MRYAKIKIQGMQIFYREDGDKDKPPFVLFHGFPSSSHMFRNLIPLLKNNFHVIAMDYPGFGQSDIPAREKFIYTFDNIAEVVDEFLKILGVEKFYMYVFD